MTIKSKLTLNILIVLLIVAVVVATSIFGMRFINSKLSYLTQKSTPYQMRTLEFQREIQGATASLAKTGSAVTLQELQEFRREAEQRLNEVDKSQQQLEALGGEKQATYQELQAISAELFKIIEDRLHAQEAAEKSSAHLTKKLEETTDRLKGLDNRIRNLQGNRALAFSSALSDSSRLSDQLRGIENTRLQLKDLQLAFADIRNADKRTSLLIGRGKMNAVVNKLKQNSYLKETKGGAYDADIDWLGGHLEELQKTRGAWLAQKDDSLKNKMDTLINETNEKLNAFFLIIEQDAVQMNERHSVETSKQGTMYGQSNRANVVLIANSELVRHGLAIEASAIQLFTYKSSTEIDRALPLIKADFARAAQVASTLESNLQQLGVKEELTILKNTRSALTGIQQTLFSEQGLVATLKKRFEMEQRVHQISMKLRDLVLKQASLGKEAVTTAQGNQEKAIASVNRIIRTSIAGLTIISIGAVLSGVLIGIWVFRSVSKPLAQLITVADQVAGGDLKEVQLRSTKDEFATVLTSVGSMVTNLRGMVSRITDATVAVSDSSNILADTATGLERCSEVQSQQIEQSVTAMTEMTQAIQDVSQNALSTSDAAGRMKHLALEGQDSLNRTSKELFSFAEVVQQSVERVEQLGARSDAINAIVDIIKDIADQTNLLALNASIEAARAGDMGRGFAVVADSVRQLAHRTTESADEIAITVKEMQTEVTSSVSSMQKERTAIEIIVQHLDDTQRSMGEIVGNVEHVFEMVQTIATATEEQSATAEDVNRSMMTIHTLTGQLNRSMDEIKDASHRFATLANDLRQMINWFRL
jgi:methyl-accepting chemotaxis protein